MTPSAPTGTGRPRDPTMEERVRQAACDLYGRVGWAGFSIDAVAREARVGKSSIYLRWADQTALLLDALQARIGLPLDTDTGSLRTDLLVLSRSTFALLASDVGDTVVRLSAEARSVPELAPRWAEFISAQATAMRAITQRGIARGDLPESTPVTVMLDALFGGLLMHFMATPPTRMRRMARDVNEYTEALVDMLLAAVTKT
ncbi:TetR-like C-terminal domain-containing protein [Mycobacterium vicinigordonae]|uniref:TetR/AcrR family transcriptional regulator n=1 Tax=Mycobacterium vicinigordonae TaxID=1719132 RepID=A0A7D6I8P5_9MYCO|nr:TetR-like C-terminal domain-containing protein [Mycobacterium vicinigordonae]QLL09818.1 TetR/AcrR family transcriptional regulator [Mycobacterium vicinigordonae]